MFGARAARAALGEPAVEARAAHDAAAQPGPTKPPALTPQSRRALWELAGIERTGAGLRELSGDPHPLVQLVARGALAREESRGAHQRTDHPRTEPALDHQHVTVHIDRDTVLESWN